MKKVFQISGVILFGAAAVAAFGAVVMSLWNWLMPCIFGLAAINFWQALGLFLLAKILFGSFGYHFHGNMKGRYPTQLHEKWMKMTNEERKEFMKRRRFGHGFGFDFEETKETEKEDANI
jgi:hypothetical protein